jgi:predicted nucleic acid-binding protein
VIVADTNLIVYLVMPSPYTEAAERLLIRDPDWVVPFLWRSEFRNVLSLYLRKGLIRFDQALAIQAEMETLFQGKEYDVTSLDVLSLTHHSGCSAYDCEFVALAKALDIKLVTMDRKLVTCFPDTAMLLTAFCE